MLKARLLNALLFIYGIHAFIPGSYLVCMVKVSQAFISVSYLCALFKDTCDTMHLCELEMF
jgi:hypothetical protein